MLRRTNLKLKDACWEGYEAIGKTRKNGKEVPNCVPKRLRRRKAKK